MEEDPFGFGVGFDAPSFCVERKRTFASVLADDHGEDMDMESPSLKKMAVASMGCGGPLSPGDVEERHLMFAALAAKVHGESVDLLSQEEPRQRGTGAGMGCGGPLCPGGMGEQRLIVASLAAKVHGEFVDLLSRMEPEGDSKTA